MRLWHRHKQEQWITDPSTGLRPGDARVVVMLLGLWAGFAAAISYADSPATLLHGGHVNQTL